MEALRNILRDVNWLKEDNDYNKLTTYQKNTINSIAYNAKKSLTKYKVVGISTIHNSTYEVGTKDKVHNLHEFQEDAVTELEEAREHMLGFYVPGYEPWLFFIEEVIE